MEPGLSKTANRFALFLNGVRVLEFRDFGFCDGPPDFRGWPKAAHPLWSGLQP